MMLILLFRNGKLEKSLAVQEAMFSLLEKAFEECSASFIYVANNGISDFIDFKVSYTFIGL